MVTHIHLFDENDADNDNGDGAFMPTEELDENYTDIGHLVQMVGGESNKDKKRQTLKHVNYYLKHQKTFPFKCYKDMKLSDVNDEFCGALSTYFGRHARKYCSIKKDLLSYLSSYNYMSAYKNIVLDDHKDEPEPAVFAKAKWGKYMRAIFKEKSQQAKKEEKVSI